MVRNRIQIARSVIRLESEYILIEDSHEDPFHDNCNQGPFPTRIKPAGKVQCIRDMENIRRQAGGQRHDD